MWHSQERARGRRLTAGRYGKRYPFAPLTNLTINPHLPIPILSTTPPLLHPPQNCKPKELLHGIVPYRLGYKRRTKARTTLRDLADRRSQSLAEVVYGGHVAGEEDGAVLAVVEEEGQVEGDEGL